MKQSNKVVLITSLIANVILAVLCINLSKNQPQLLSSAGLFSEIQNWRMSKGEATYIVDQKLCSYADKRLNQILTDFSHKGFEASSAEELGVTGFRRIGENLSMGFIENRAVLVAWLNSKSHRENLEESYTHSCLKCLNNYCVQIFASY